MPIAQINKDGTVKIYNSNTGETKDVAATDLSRYNPKLVGEYYKMTQAQTTDPVKELANTKAQKELSGIQNGQAVTSDADQKEIKKYQDVANNVSLLEKNYGEVKSKGKVAGGVSELLSSLTGGASNPDVGDYEALRKSMIGPLARTISGEVGVLTDKDISRAEGLLPKISDDPRLAAKKLENLKVLISAKTGQQNPSAGQQAADQSPQSVVPSSPQSPQQPLVSPQPGQPGLAFLAAQQRSQQPQQSPMDSINKFMYNNVASGPVGDAASGLLNILNPRIANVAEKSGQGQNVSADELLGAGGELASDVIPVAGVGGLATRLGIAGAVKGATTPGASAGERVKNAGFDALIGVLTGKAGQATDKIIHPFRTVGAMKQAAVAEASGKTISGDKIYSALESKAESLSPTVRQGYLKFLTQSSGDFKGQEIPVAKAVDLASSANDAYSAAGKVGKAASAKFNDVLAKSIKEEIKSVAPKVTQANKLFSYLYGAQRNVVPIAKNAAIVAGIYAALSKLGIGGQSQ